MLPLLAVDETLGLFLQDAERKYQHINFQRNEAINHTIDLLKTFNNSNLNSIMYSLRNEEMLILDNMPIKTNAWKQMLSRTFPPGLSTTQATHTHLY